MSCSRELPPWDLSLTITSATTGYIWENMWNPTMGVTTVDFMADVRNVSAVGGAGPGISLKPALQLAAVRPDRPAAGAILAAGSAITTNGTTHYQETLSAGAYFFWRRGFSFKLTGIGATFGAAEVKLYTCFRACGSVFSPREVVFNPTDDNTDASYFPLTGPFCANAVDKAKLAIVGLANSSSTMQYSLAARAFNDKMARGNWTDILAFASPSPTTGDFEANTGDVAFTGITLANYQWAELALGVKTTAAGTPPRVIFQVIPAISYT